MRINVKTFIGVAILEFVIAILIGVGLSAAVGFRVFTPLLITSIAEKTSMVTLAEGFTWIGSTPALVAFLVATILEIGGSYIPIVDQLLKMLATPVAIIAGILLTASFIGDMEPLLTWSIAIIAGGSTASVSQITTASIKGTSTIATGGIGNIFISLGEGIIAVVMSLVSIMVPFLALFFVILLFIIFVFVLIRVRKVFPKRKTVNI